MLKRITENLSKNPAVFSFLRKIIEFNFLTLKRIIKREFSLDNPDSRLKTILDAPCGTGEFAGLFAHAAYTGIDICPEYIAYAKKKYQGGFYCRDALRNGFPDACFDNVLILGLFHHIDLAGVSAVLGEGARVLKKTGRILLIEDAPVVSGWNFIGRFLQRYDVGDNIRPAAQYLPLLDKYFSVEKYYPVTNGFWNYSVFVLKHKG